ncbi:MAG: hypothetical protein H0V69_09280 [Acidimicrobiia bacterium]|nr:hypothetical protein [Acidimicrobiia bacterium]
MSLSTDEARRYISKVRWQYAVTMPGWPHEYTVKSWRPELSKEFVAFCRLIADQGVREPWPSPPAKAIYHNRYLVIGEHKYWAMGPYGDLNSPQEMTVINRAGTVALIDRVGRDTVS